MDFEIHTTYKLFENTSLSTASATNGMQKINLSEIKAD